MMVMARLTACRVVFLLFAVALCCAGGCVTATTAVVSCGKRNPAGCLNAPLNADVVAARRIMALLSAGEADGQAEITSPEEQCEDSDGLAPETSDGKTTREPCKKTKDMKQMKTKDKDGSEVEEEETRRGNDGQEIGEKGPAQKEGVVEVEQVKDSMGKSEQAQKKGEENKERAGDDEEEARAEGDKDEEGDEDDEGESEEDDEGEEEEDEDEDEEEDDDDDDDDDEDETAVPSQAPVGGGEKGRGPTSPQPSASGATAWSHPPPLLFLPAFICAALFLWG